jgi:hypothetical protein
VARRSHHIFLWQPQHPRVYPQLVPELTYPGPHSHLIFQSAFARRIDVAFRWPAAPYPAAPPSCTNHHDFHPSTCRITSLAVRSALFYSCFIFFRRMFIIACLFSCIPCRTTISLILSCLGLSRSRPLLVISNLKPVNVGASAITALPLNLI